jgi:hypothetical protein
MNSLEKTSLSSFLPHSQVELSRGVPFWEESCRGSSTLSTRKLATMRTESYLSRNEANALSKKFRLDIQDRRPIAQLRGDRDALQKRVKDLKAELATLRERDSLTSRN